MNKTFHQTLPLIVFKKMPKEFQEYYLQEGYTLDHLQYDADLPDLVDKDNITENADIHHDHSYKLEEVIDELDKNKKYLKWKDGNALERLKGLCADANDFRREKTNTMVRYCLSKLTHYAIDGSCTYPHLHSGKPWSNYHEKFEIEMGHFIEQQQEELEKIEFEFVPYEDIYKDSRHLSEKMWYQGKDIVKKLENNEDLIDEEKSKICKTAIQHVGNVWITLMNEMKII